MTKPPSLVRRTPWPESISRPVVTPLQPSVVYAADAPDTLDRINEGKESGYVYAREAHPNADILATKIDGMEGATGGTMTGSGMSAILAAIMSVMNSGDHIIAADQIYGQSQRLMSDHLPRFGVSSTLVDPTNAGAVERAIRPETKAILIEVVANPTLRIADCRRIAELARKHGLTLIVDNTFTTPRAFRPFQLDADIVVHSVTKLLAGHSDATLGYVVAKDHLINDKIRELCVTWGLTASPFDCWLAERGLYSFELRYDRAQSNASRLAKHLAVLPGVKRVLYPMRSDHPDHIRAKDLLGSQGGNMVSFEIEGGRETANRFTRAAKNIAFAATLGDIGTTISHPLSSSHRGLDDEKCRSMGISEGFFRVSVGVEDPEMLCEEFETSLRQAFD